MKISFEIVKSVCQLFIAMMLALLWSACTPASKPAATKATKMDTAAYRPSAADLAFLDTLERRSFDFFWETTDPKTGLVPDRYPTRAFSSIAAIGFGLSCYLVGAERGYITREQARDRVETTLTYLWRLPQSADKIQTAGYKGFFYHFLRYENGLRYRDTELSSIDTALLLAGILSCQTYFDRADSSETNIRMVADSIYRRVEWTWMTTKPPVVSMGWHPENGSQKGGKFIDSNWDGYDEAMILYVLALGSPTFAPDSTVWKQWTEPYVWGKFYGGEEHVNFSPLFGHQYSHVWIDFRGIQDDYMQAKGTNYFENSRRATYANRAYCLANPMQWRDYGDSLWGLTACDGPADTSFVRNGKPVQFHSYWARGASLLEIHDDGTLAPTAAGGSVPFAPEICIPALRGFEAKYGEKFFKRYGFLDAINPSYAATDTGSGWIDVDYLGIDQGPIVLMLENYRSEFVWKLMQRNPYIRRGLMRAGFQGGWL